MKTAEEINNQVSIMKDALVVSDGGQTLLIQGYVRALQWVLSEKKDDGFSEEVE